MVAAIMKAFSALSRVALMSLCLAVWPLRAADAPTNGKHGYTATFTVKVDEQGNPEEVSLYRSDDDTPDSILNKMAAAMALKAKLPPRTKDGHPVKYIARVPFFFPIEGDEGAEANNQPKPRGRGDVSKQPTYPPEMAEKGIVGGVILELVIDAKGDLARVTTLRASHPEFEKAALDAVNTWKFHPAEKDGTPVETRWRVAIVFETPEHLVDLKWRVPPRPALGTFMAIRSNHPLMDEEPAPAATPAPAGEPAPAPKP